MKAISSLDTVHQTCSTDMLAVLKNLEQMFQTYRYCQNEYAAQAMLIGLAVEAHTLALKLKTMCGRWKKFLPFHEFIDVDFDYWKGMVGEWMVVLNQTASQEVRTKYPWLVGSKEYMLDLYALSKQEERFYEGEGTKGYRQEMTACMERMDALLGEMQDNGRNAWRRKVDDGVARSLCESCDGVLSPTESGMMKQRLEVLMEFDQAETVVVMTLLDLKMQLSDLQALFDSNLPNEAFVRLSVRLFYSYCQESKQQGEVRVNKWRNSWPEAKRKKYAAEKKEELMRQLKEKPYGMELMEYVSPDTRDLVEDANMGRFLFKNRRKLATKDLQDIHRIFRELCLLDDLLHERLTSDRMGADCQRTAQELQILNRVMELAGQAPWSKVTKQEAIAALQRALEPETADEEVLEMSGTLWTLLKKRKNCDGKKSLMVTWLNLVGYGLSRGLMEGKGPTLARSFFSDCNADDYKAIDKGRNPKENKHFKRVIPLLDACFGVENVK